MQLLVIDFIQSVGFPIFVACYLLFYQSRVIKENTKMIRELKEWLQRNERRSF